jgi:antirestriction protein ArdC
MTTNRNRQARAGKDIYQCVTDQIIAAIEAGASEYRMPWHHDGSSITTPVNVASRNAYRGVNVVALWAAAQAAAYPSGIWGTYRQWCELGAQVRKGERGHLVLFWKQADRERDSDRHDGDEGHDEPARRMFARGYTVFNCAQVDGYTPPKLPALPGTERIADAERFCAALTIDIRHGGSQACYIPSQDYVQMPTFASFRDAIAYYAVLLHECGHASGAKHRLDRDLTGRFGSAAYAMEECAVELLSAMICADLNLSVEPRPDHAAYIASWLEQWRARHCSSNQQQFIM